MRAVDEREIDRPSVALALARGFAMRRRETEHFAAFDDIPVREREFAPIGAWIEAEYGVDREIPGEMRVQPAHVGRAALRSRSPTVIHRRNAIDGIGLAAHGDATLEMTGLVEVSVIRGAPGELAAGLRGLQRVRLHRIH